MAPGPQQVQVVRHEDWWECSVTIHPLCFVIQIDKIKCKNNFALPKFIESLIGDFAENQVDLKLIKSQATLSGKYFKSREKIFQQKFRDIIVNNLALLKSWDKEHLTKPMVKHSYDGLVGTALNYLYLSPSLK